MTLLFVVAPLIVIVSFLALGYLIWSHEDDRWAALEEYSKAVAKGTSTNVGRLARNDLTHKSGGLHELA